jgi:glyoxylase-like metal-dependent hydrolase (beta-lactamase superfamily II)
VYITEEVYIVGSGLYGFGLSSRYDCNVYLIDGSGELALVDSGCGLGGKEIETNIAEHGFEVSQVRKILLTHCHADHAGGAAYFRRTYGSVIYVPAEEVTVLEALDRVPLTTAKEWDLYPADYQAEPCTADVALSHDTVISCGTLAIHSILTPGHSRGSTCFLLSGSQGKVLFSGDTVFSLGIVGLLNNDDCDIAAYRKSIGRLAGLGVESLLPGHRGFTVRYGQHHIDRAIEAFRDFRLPPHL